MSFTIDTAQEQPINLAPQTLYEEVIQNVWFLLSSLEYDIPLNREFGLNAAYIDKPITTATALATADIYDKIGEYEPRAGGMITTQQNLDNLLAAGKITQEEYNEYYPYDGMEQSYYSVFVETDLNTASTLSGKRLPTEDAIAEYIAGMLLLENDPVFYISYEGIYTTGGTDFYEFRCHR